MEKHLIVYISAIVTLFTLAWTNPHPAAAFGGAGCGEGECSSCHELKVEDASRILEGLVDKVDKVDFSEVPGLYSVEVESKGKKYLIYVDFSEKFIISGNVIRITDRSNRTREELMTIRRIDPTIIPIGDALVIGNPKAPKKIIVFTDPQCPYCKNLHHEIKKVVKADPDIVFFIKLYPLKKIHPDSYRIAQAIVCEDSIDLLEASFAGKKIPDPECESDVVDNTIELARKLGITSTPTMVLPDGRLATGYMPSEDILKLIDGGGGKNH